VTVAATAEDVQRALGKMQEMLRLDGYELEVAVDAGRVALAVQATAEACEECLVPKDLFASMAAAMLTEGGVAATAADLVVTYPAG
jgi:hypothetical protein